MKYEAVYTVEILVGTELVVNHNIKAHDIEEVIRKLSKKYLDKDKIILDKFEY